MCFKAIKLIKCGCVSSFSSSLTVTVMLIMITAENIITFGFRVLFQRTFSFLVILLPFILYYKLFGGKCMKRTYDSLYSSVGYESGLYACVCVCSFVHCLRQSRMFYCRNGNFCRVYSGWKKRKEAVVSSRCLEYFLNAYQLRC